MTKIIAHRGASGYAPENTMEAFKLAIKQKADMIETDVHLSKDGTLIIMHDETIDRTTNGIGYIKDMTFKELNQFNANNHMEQFEFCSIPKLDELLQLIKQHQILLNIEIKTDIINYPGIEQKLIDIIKLYNVEDQIIYSSFNHYTLKNIKQLNPNAKIAILYSQALYKPWEYAKKINAQYIHPYYPNLRIPEYIKHCHELNIKVNTWTVNQRFNMKELINLKVDGIITNYPDIAYQLIHNNK